MGEDEVQSELVDGGGALRNTIYRRLTRSQRRMGPMRRALYAIAAPILVALVRLGWRSCRVVAVVGEEHLDAVIRGSSSHTGAQALKGYFQALMREQVSPVINPDGPRGPRFKFKLGAVLLSQLSGRPMLPLAYAASRAWPHSLGSLRAAGAVLSHRDRYRTALRYAANARRRGGAGDCRRHGASPPRDLPQCPSSTVGELSLGKIRG